LRTERHPMKLILLATYDQTQAKGTIQVRFRAR
jgi:hypothetical protein